MFLAHFIVLNVQNVFRLKPMFSEWLSFFGFFVYNDWALNLDVNAAIFRLNAVNAFIPTKNAVNAAIFPVKRR